jgi:hypothetical protein
MTDSSCATTGSVRGPPRDKIAHRRGVSDDPDQAVTSADIMPCDGGCPRLQPSFRGFNVMMIVCTRAQELYALEDLVADYAELKASTGQV